MHSHIGEDVWEHDGVSFKALLPDSPEGVEFNNLGHFSSPLLNR